MTVVRSIARRYLSAMQREDEIVRGIETTVRALSWARVRHFGIGVVCAVLCVTAFSARNRLASSHTSATWVSAAEWLCLVAGGLGWYHLREWRGKGRRYRNQRQRAANELLRADFRRARKF